MSVKFGKIIAALRKEQFDPIEGRVLSQETLAQRANLSSRTIGEIERGKKVVLDQGTLKSLAIALNLGPLEQREFFYAALGMEHDKTADKKNPEEILQRLIEELRTLQIPAMIHDSLYFVIAVNEAWLKVKGLSHLDCLNLRESRKHSNKLNYIELLLHESLSVNRVYGRHWKKFLSMVIKNFRVISLQLCHMDEYRDLLKLLLAYPLFREEWQRYLSNQPTYQNVDFKVNYDHPQLGQLMLSIYRQTTVTPFGRLYHSVETPNSRETISVLASLRENKRGQTFRFSEWGK